MTWLGDYSWLRSEHLLPWYTPVWHRFSFLQTEDKCYCAWGYLRNILWQYASPIFTLQPKQNADNCKNHSTQLGVEERWCPQAKGPEKQQIGGHSFAFTQKADCKSLNAVVRMLVGGWCCQGWDNFENINKLTKLTEVQYVKTASAANSVSVNSVRNFRTNLIAASGDRKWHISCCA